MKQYLRSTEVIDWRTPEIVSRAKDLAYGNASPAAIAKSCFEWVRDHIKHINDYDIQTVSVSASEVLKSGSGICYAKSHLLAALLRANTIPSGFCYQRLSRDDNGAPYCIHGFNAVNLPQIGWYRVDARGNKEGVNAQFTPPQEQLAFSVQREGEIDFTKIVSDPLPIIITILTTHSVKNELWDNLPDLQTI